jgi:hypothetical protein
MIVGKSILNDLAGLHASGLRVEGLGVDRDVVRDGIAKNDVKDEFHCSKPRVERVVADSIPRFPRLTFYSLRVLRPRARTVAQDATIRLEVRFDPKRSFNQSEMHRTDRQLTARTGRFE